MVAIEIMVTAVNIGFFSSLLAYIQEGVSLLFSSELIRTGLDGMIFFSFSRLVMRISFSPFFQIPRVISHLPDVLGTWSCHSNQPFLFFFFFAGNLHPNLSFFSPTIHQCIYPLTLMPIKLRPSTILVVYCVCLLVSNLLSCPVNRADTRGLWLLDECLLIHPSTYAMRVHNRQQGQQTVLT